MTEKGKQIKSDIVLFLKGIIIGGTMLVPGMSGGTMAIVLGIYDRLVSSVSSFLKHKRQSAEVLLMVAVGGVLGMILFSGMILTVINKYTMVSMYFFLGIIVGSVPAIFKQSKSESFSAKSIIYIFIGLVIVYLISIIPADTLDSADISSGGYILFLIVSGFVSAVALVLPGISISYLLLLIGMYDDVMLALNEVYLPYLLPLGIGLIAGIISVTKIVEKAMDKYPQPAHLMILGFMLGSIMDVFPGIPVGSDILLCILTFAAGAVLVFHLSRKELIKG